MTKVCKRRRGAAELATLILALGSAGAAHARQTEPVVEAPQPQVPPASAAGFDILAFQVRGNTVLAPDVVERAVYPHMGPGRSEADVEAARASLQKAFEDAGYVAVSVYVPEQSVDGGVLQLEVQQQAIGQVLVEGAARPDAVLAKAPSLTPGRTPNLPEFQRDVIAMNQTASRRVTPELRAGVAPGTLDVVLKVEESSPFHASAEINNFSSAATTDLRVSGTLRHDNLWGLGHSLSISSQTAPRRTNDGTVLSGNYLAPLGQGTQLLGYYVHSDSDIAVIGGTSVIGSGDIFGVRLIRSLGSRDGFYHSVTLGLDYKDFGEDLILGADTDSAPIAYVPATLAWRGDWTGEQARTDVNVSAVLGLRGLGDGLARFMYKRLYARDGFFVLKLDAGRVQDTIGDMQVSTRLTAQWSPDPLISNEGFSLGGMSSVRGYFESEAIGDYGFAYQSEVRSPDLAGLLGDPVNELRFLGFVDSGYAGVHRVAAGQDDSFSQASTGLGARLKVFRIFNGAVDVGTPLISGPDSDAGSIFARFRIWGEF